MINLTKPMEIFGPGDIIQRVEKLRDPDDLFQGTCEDGARTPKNLLLFSRTRADKLQIVSQQKFQHRRHVLILNLRTTGAIAVDGRWHKLEPGHALLIFPFQVHAFGKLESDSLCWLFLTFEEDSSASLSTLRNRAIPFKADQIMPIWIDQLLCAWRPTNSDPAEVAHLAALILNRLQQKALKKNSPKASSRKRPRNVSPDGLSKESSSLLPAIHDIIEHGQPGCRIKELARQLNISESHLRAEFRRQTGSSLGTYLRQIRINRAAALLAGANLRVNEVASRCGFETPYAFSRAFRHATGKSPREFRQEIARKAKQ